MHTYFTHTSHDLAKLHATDPKKIQTNNTFQNVFRTPFEALRAWTDLLNEGQPVRCPPGRSAFCSSRRIKLQDATGLSLRVR